MQKVIAWNSGSGNITLTYTGQGNDTVTVSSDANNLTTLRSQTITFKTTDNSVTKQVTVSQLGKQNTTVTVNASASLSATGTSTATGTISWTAPSIPSGSTIVSVTMDVRWSWNGRGNISNLSVNGTTVPADTLTTVTLPNNVTSPVTVTCRGNNRNATGNHFTWNTLTVTYEYT